MIGSLDTTEYIGKGVWMDSHRHEEWVRVERTAAFQAFARKRKAFLIPATIFFLVFFFGLPVLAAFTTVLDGRAVGSLTWAYVYGFAQFVMTWVLMHIYVHQANKWDELVQQALHETAEEEVQ
ncbi:MAG: hypothetical protein QOI57_2436 [Rubrobacteraceae bacterium]|nr:hypothetical protein [Rubrobacteraceae bacterium]